MDQIPKAVKGTVQALLDKKDEMNIQDRICDVLDLNRVSLYHYFKCVRWSLPLVRGTVGHISAVYHVDSS